MIEKYEDTLKPRRIELSNFVWSSKKIDTVVAYKQTMKPTPESHKESVLRDPKIQNYINELCSKRKLPKEFINVQIQIILDEIGYNKNLRVIRWLAIILVKICLKVCKGIYINCDSILHTKSHMGNCPMIFVPSHRSYADFILMSFICFTYDIEIPAIAAGMDFQGMWAMGSILRDTGAFFMRRSYNDDALYWTTFKQYINQIVTKGELPIEFFIEGTRSRSNKSLMPKYGLLNMILKPLFLRQVPDILFVPINISYERILEEKLFSFELLGVPKPKESTSGLFKSLGILKEKFGSIHISFGQPISGRQFLGNHLKDSQHHIGPISQHELSDADKKIIPSLAHEIVHCQQKLTVLKTINLIAFLVNYNLTYCDELFSIVQLGDKIMQIKTILEKLNANVWSSGDIESDVMEALDVHKNMLCSTPDGKIDLLKNQISLKNMNVDKLKAYRLSEDIMTHSVPFVMLQIYLNPVLYYFVDIALILTILKKYSPLNKDTLSTHYTFLRTVFIHEFVAFEPKISLEFENLLNHCLVLNFIKVDDGRIYSVPENWELQEMLVGTIQPFLYSYYITVQTIESFGPNGCDEKTISTYVQRHIVSEMDTKLIHPYSLNLDSISLCLNSLTSLGVLTRSRSPTGVKYVPNRENIEKIRIKFEQFLIHVRRKSMVNVDVRHKL